MQFEKLTRNVVELRSEYETIVLCNSHAGGGKTLYAIREALINLAEGKKVIYFSSDVEPLEMYKKAEMVGNELAKEDPGYIELEGLAGRALVDGVLEFANSTGKTMHEINMKISRYAPDLKFIEKKIEEFSPGFIVIDHVPQLEIDNGFLGELHEVLKKNKCVAMVTRQVQRDLRV